MTVSIPTLPLAPEVNLVAARIFDRLPQAYRVADAHGGYPLRLYIEAVTARLGDVQVVIDRITGQRPVGPASPEPWSLHPDMVEDYRANRVMRISELGDPLTADAAWLPWLVQLVGGTLDPAASVAEQRDTVRYATSGWKAGTRDSIQNAARSALIGSQYAKVIPHQLADGNPGQWYDVVVVTRSSETPDVSAVLGAVLRKGVKPAGVVLRHRPVGTTWNQIEALRPTWDDWENDDQGAVTWNRWEETGFTYASVPGNLLVNASYEANVNNWTAGANTTKAHIAGGVDGVGQCRLTATALGQVSIQSDAVAADDTTDYRTACSVKPTAIRTARLKFHHSTGAVSTGPDVELPANVWTRLPQLVATSPPTATTISVSIQIDGLAAAETVAVDAWDLRSYTG